VAGIGTGLYYDRGHILQARNEYNKAALSTVTLNEFKQVTGFILPKKPTERPPRESRNMWMDLRTI